MLLYTSFFLLAKVTIVRSFLLSPTIFFPHDVAFSRLSAVESTQNNAFDLIDKGLRVTLSEELGITQPNEMQNESIAAAIRGDDTFVIAQTGSGKTMSFLLPILHRLNKTSSLSSRESVAIIIGPTSELLAQHSRIASKLMPSAIDRVLFRTPEQILDRYGTDDEDLANIDIVAIDEVDAVLCGSEFNDTAPERSIDLLDSLPCEAQFILTTAYLTRAHTKIISRLFPDIKTIRQSSSSQRVLVPTLRQVFHYFSGDMTAKLEKLENILEKSETEATIIFCRDEGEVEAVHLFLSRCPILNDTFAPEKLHVDMSSEERSSALSLFCKNDGYCRMLVTHEIAARGLDYPSVRHVILFDTPTDVTAFVHRAGRTARAGEEGVVTCLVQAGVSGGLGSFGDSGGSFGKHKNLHALLDAPKLNFAKPTDDEANDTSE